MICRDLSRTIAVLAHAAQRAPLNHLTRGLARIQCETELYLDNSTTIRGSEKKLFRDSYNCLSWEYSNLEFFVHTQDF